ncbi:MAG: hypothetical protein QFX33_04735 [Candidatus Nezhaarchaeota archaeon]|nr:hypothetical protein [Candidatus Nezhaarchaeota archaeon]
MSFELYVPTCIIGQAIVHRSQPALCYNSRNNRLSLSVKPGLRSVEVMGLGVFSDYVKRRVEGFLKRIEGGLSIQCSGPMHPMDALISTLHATLSAGLDGEVHGVSRMLRINYGRAKLTLRALKAKGVMAYREGERALNLQDYFPWRMGLALKPPFRFRLPRDEGLEESLDVIIHALGRLVVAAARSISDGDFKLFGRALERYSRISIALSGLPATMMRTHKLLNGLKGVACKVDEDFKGFMLFSEGEEELREALNAVGKMGFRVALLRC